MNTVKLTIDDRDIEVPAGRSVLEAAKELNISIPTMCYSNGYERFTSCMVCVVYEVGANRLLPACSAVVSEGMRIETKNALVREARKDALDFLLSEHAGDCDAPCRRACPAHMDIPLMIRQIEEGRLDDAIRMVKKDIALPAVLGRICPAPCEKGCHRNACDAPVSICLLKRYVADIDLMKDSPFSPPLGESRSGKKVAVVGAGPTGLSAAYFLVQDGHSCHVYDKNPLPGGMLRYGVPDKDLARSILDAEIERIKELGTEFYPGHTLGTDLTWDRLREEYDAVVLAVGKADPSVFEGSGVTLSGTAIGIDRKTYQTCVPGFFAGGNAVSVTESRMAIRALAHGKDLAFAINQYLGGLSVTGPPSRFQSMLGKIDEGEAGEFLKEAGTQGRTVPGDLEKGFTDREAVVESERCFGCDCRKPDTCRLRQYAEEYEASQRRFRFAERKEFRKNIRHDMVVYEPGKCIKCGLCVQITKKAGEIFGLTFVDRGFDVRVETPFGVPLSQGLAKAAGDCVAACPTGALSWKNRRKKEEDALKGKDYA